MQFQNSERQTIYRQRHTAFNLYLGNSLGRIVTPQLRINTLLDFVFTEFWCCLEWYQNQTGQWDYMNYLMELIMKTVNYFLRTVQPRNETHLSMCQCTWRILVKTYPRYKTLLSTWHSRVHRFPTSEKLQKNHTKTVNITFLRQLTCHGIPAIITPKTSGKQSFQLAFDQSWRSLCIFKGRD